MNQKNLLISHHLVTLSSSRQSLKRSIEITTRTQTVTIRVTGDYSTGPGPSVLYSRSSATGDGENGSVPLRVGGGLGQTLPSGVTNPRERCPMYDSGAHRPRGRRRMTKATCTTKRNLPFFLSLNTPKKPAFAPARSRPFLNQTVINYNTGREKRAMLI